MAPDPERWADEIELLRQDLRIAIHQHFRMVHAELGPAKTFHEFANHLHETALRQADELADAMDSVEHPAWGIWAWRRMLENHGNEGVAQVIDHLLIISTATNRYVN